MFVPAILPLKITCVVVGGRSLIFLLFSIALGVARVKSLLGMLVFGGLLFVPAWAAIHATVDKTRYGGFAYPDFGQVNNSRVARWLPPSATDITAYCKYHMHHVRFRINEDDLVSWVNEYRADNSQDEEDKVPYTGADLTVREMDEEYFPMYYGEFGWTCPPDYIEMRYSSRPSDAEFTVWYSKGQGVAYLRGGYW